MVLDTATIPDLLVSLPRLERGDNFIVENIANKLLKWKSGTVLCNARDKGVSWNIVEYRVEDDR